MQEIIAERAAVSQAPWLELGAVRPGTACKSSITMVNVQDREQVSTVQALAGSVRVRDRLSGRCAVSVVLLSSSSKLASRCSNQSRPDDTGAASSFSLGLWARLFSTTPASLDQG